jgi:murein DD-endopeptidase MepM/ murein hydrolase activator NlpD
MMRKGSSLLILLYSAFFIFFMFTYADAFNADVLPSEINPGDAFIVKLTGLETKELPGAVLNNRQLYFSSCGEGCFYALSSVDADTEPGTYYIQVNDGENKKTINLFVRKAVFPTIELTLPEEKVFLSPKDQERADREAEKLNVLWQTASERLWQGNFILPSENNISTVFGTTRILNKKKISVHKGIDIKGKEGEAVKASNRGRVVLAEDLFFGGNTIILDHGQGIYSIYMHLSEFKVKTGDMVSGGSVIGAVGSSGRASGPHLHFGIRVQTISANPVSISKLKL